MKHPEISIDNDCFSRSSSHYSIYILSGLKSIGFSLLITTFQSPVRSFHLCVKYTILVTALSFAFTDHREQVLYLSRSQEDMTSTSPQASSTSNKKRALVIGNDHYRQGRTLRHCAEMARAIHEKLSTIQFQVTLCIDLTCAQFDTVLENFTETINVGDLVLFFFSGYGTFYRDQNYLLPIDDHNINALTMFNSQCIRIDELMEMIKERSPSSSIYIFDTFRSYTLSYVTAANGLNDFGGLGPVEALDGSLILFPCEPHKIMADNTNNGRPNAFFRHLLENIDKPNLSINDMLNLIWEEVLNETSNGQCPYKSNALQKPVYLNYQIDFGKADLN